MKRLFILLCILCLPITLLAQHRPIVGRVLDDRGAPLIGAHVRAVEQKDAATTITDHDGQFRLTADSGRSIEVEVSYIGFRTERFILTTNRPDKVQTIRLKPDATALEQVVVTATLTPKALKDVPVVTRLITAHDIRKTDATNVQDLLTEELPGLEFSYAMSQETSLSMSGFGGNAVLFLVDGERLAGETMDNVDYSRLNLDNVGRIEVVKGAASALYGSNAVGGVVNIISRESSEPWTASVSSRYRSAGNEWRHGASLSFNAGRFNSQTNVQRTTVDAIQLTDAFDTQSKIQQVFGGETLNVKERLQFRASDRLKLIARGGYFKRWSNRVNYEDRYTDYSGGLKGVYNIHEGRTLEVSYAYDQYDKARFIGGRRTDEHDYSNRQHVVHTLYNHSLGDHTLTVGADYLHDYLTTYQFTDNNVKKQHSADAFAQMDLNPAAWLNLLGSLRYDYFSASDVHSVTARLAVMLKWTGFSVRASYAGGFRAPTLKEMYMDFDMAGMQMIYGNPDLDPERSHNFSLALEHAGRLRSGWLSGQYNLTLMGYYNRFNNRITTVECPSRVPEPDEASMYTNEKGVKVAGLECSAQYRSETGLGLKLNYNYLAENGRTVDSQFSQTRPHSMTWRCDYDRQICSSYGLNVALSGRYLSKPDSKLETDDAYTLWKFTLQQRIWHGINVNFMVDNLLDYRPKVYYWNSPATTGRTWSVGISLNIDRML